LGRSGLIGFSSGWEDEEDEAEVMAMRREWRYEEEEQECLAQGDKEGARIAREKLAAARRLHRVEIIYVSERSVVGRHRGKADIVDRKAHCRSCRAA
jgi:hypothetical protein